MSRRTRHAGWAFAVGLGLLVVGCEGPRDRAAAAERTLCVGAPTSVGELPGDDRRVVRLEQPWSMEIRDARPQGAEILTVEADSPANGVLKPGDIVTFADASPIASSSDLERTLATTRPTEPIRLDVDRRGQTLEVEIPKRAVDVRPPAAPPSAPVVASAPAPAPAQTIVLVMPAAQQAPPQPEAPVFAVGGGIESSARPPAYYAPGIAQAPGATFPPPPGAQMEAGPLIPGATMPYYSLVPLGAGHSPSGLGMGTPGAGAPASQTTLSIPNVAPARAGMVALPRGMPHVGAVRGR